MRIISGTHKGKRLSAPKNLPVRPTTDFAKEGLFNILNNRIFFDEVSLVELFSGTGNISYEFASRGCKQITSVDANFNCIKYISKTAEQLNFEIQTIKADVFKFLDTANIKADIFFADPPYDFNIEQLDDLVSKILTNNLLKSEGFIIIEHTKHTNLSEVSGFQESRKYGNSMFSFFTQ